MESDSPTPKLEVVDLSRIKEIASDSKLSEIVEKKSDSFAEVCQLLVDPMSVAPGSLNDDSKDIIMQMINAMISQGTNYVDQEKIENYAPPAPFEPNEQLFIESEFLAPVTLRFKKSAKEMTDYYKETEEKNSKLASQATIPNPELSKSIKIEGNVEYHKENYTTALTKYSEAIYQNPVDVSYYLNRALTYLQTSHPDLSVSDCQRAIDLNPNFIKGYLRKGLAYMMMNHEFDAIDCFETVSNRDPENPDAIKYRQKIITKLITRKLNAFDNAMLCKFLGVESRDHKLYIKEGKDHRFMQTLYDMLSYTQ